MKKLSIIVAAYNVESYIEECLSSIVSLGLTIETEVIVINDGSRDRTLEIIDGFDERNIRVINIENSGISVVRNIGILESTGDYIYFVDGDDSINQLDFINFFKQLDQNFDVLIAGYNTYINKNTGYKSVTKKINDIDYGDGIFILNKYFMREFETAVWRVFVKREIVINNNVFFTKGILIAEDAEWLVKLLIISQKVYFDNSKKIYNYRLRPGSVMRSKFNEKKFDNLLYVANSLKKFSNQNSVNLYIINKYILSLVMQALVFSNHKINNIQFKKIKEILRDLNLFYIKPLLVCFLISNFPRLSKYFLKIRFKIYNLGKKIY